LTDSFIYIKGYRWNPTLSSCLKKYNHKPFAIPDFLAASLAGCDAIVQVQHQQKQKQKRKKANADNM